MRTWSLLAAALVLVLGRPVLADLPVGPLPSPNAKPFVIEADPNAKEAKLTIPREMLGKMKASAEQGNEDEAYASSARTHTIIAGVALTMALAFSGLWLVRRTPGGSRNLALLIGALGFLGISGALYANKAAPKPAIDLTNFVIIEVVDKGDAVKLVVNKDKLSKVPEKK